jgi:hypothetical protein
MPDAQTGAECAQTAPYYRWVVSDLNITIEVSDQAAACITAEGARGLGLVPRRGAEVGGLLLGAVERGEQTVVRIEQALPVPCEYAFGPSYILSGKDRERFRGALDGTGAVGFFRTDTRARMTFSEGDVSVFREFFADPASVALLVKPSMMEASAAVCWVRDGAEVREAGQLEWRPQPRYSQPRQEQDEVAPPAPEPPEIPLPAFLSAHEPRKRRAPLRLPRWYSWLLQAPLLILLLVADSTLGYFAASRLAERPRPGKALQNPYALSMVVLQYGDNLHLSWDRDAAPIAIARGGTLIISDGSFTRTLDLTPTQLREGSVIYRRLTPEVSLKLEVFVAETGSVCESWRLTPAGK